MNQKRARFSLYLFIVCVLNHSVVAAEGEHSGGSDSSGARQADKTAEDAGPSKAAESLAEALDGYPYPIPMMELPPPKGTVEMNFSENRCDPGILRFGYTQCRVMGRGFGADSCVDPSSYDQPNGHTPVGEFRLKDHPIGNKTSWGEEPAIAILGTPNRAGIVFHDVARAKNTKPEMPGQMKTAGCPRINDACLAALNHFMLENQAQYKGEGVPIKITDRAPTPLPLPRVGGSYQGQGFGF